MTLFTPQGAIPGHRDIDESGEVQVWKAPEGIHGYFTLSSDVVLASTNTDTGNTGDTTTLRGGNLIATETSLGNEYIYDADANDGTQSAWGVLVKHQPMLESGTATNKVMIPIMSQGVAQKSEIIGLDAQAESQLAMRGIFMDTAPQGAAALVHPVGVWRKAADYTVVAADNGKHFVATAAVNFTLPTIAVGLSFEFSQTADANLVITGVDNILGFNNAAADTITFSTSSEKIGARVRIRADYIAANTLRWIVDKVCDNTVVYAG